MAKMEWKKIPTNQQNLDTYYNSMSVSYWGLQSLVHPPRSRVTQQSTISKFNIVGYGRVGCERSRGHGGRAYGCGRGHVCGGQGGCGGRSYGQNPY